MKRILITGATGNIGTEVVRSLINLNTEDRIILGVRNIASAKQLFIDLPNIEYREFDFENQCTLNTALENIDQIFLLRPPQISDVKKYFRPLIQRIVEKGIMQIIFLSVQGAEKSKVIPHNKIEKLIRNSNLDYIFLRPSYFMQNLTTTLLNDIKLKDKIILPAGEAKFNWIDIKNIGEVSAILLRDFDLHKNREIELTGLENLDFFSVSRIISSVINRKIEFLNVNPFRFYSIKKKEGLNSGLILVMIMLHFLPRLQKDPIISDNYEILTGNKPTSLEDFLYRERWKLNAL
jgi:uncharacterized protein YbjT (DUF2867 family)